MKPCKRCKFAAMCYDAGSAGELACRLSELRFREGTVTLPRMQRWAGGGFAPLTVNESVAKLYQERPKDCPGRPV